MTKKSWRNPNKKIEIKPQKFKWNSHKVFDDYATADEERKKLLAGKQKTCQKSEDVDLMETKFKVKIGNPIKTKTEEAAIDTFKTLPNKPKIAPKSNKKKLLYLG